MGAIDFGILVDGAVVLVENVLHEAHRQKPTAPARAARLIVRSAVDVARPTFFAMAIIIAALIPVFTLERVEGRIFRPLALTYSFALLGALVFALTVVPALCARDPAPQGRARCASRGCWCGCATGTRALVAWLFGRRLARAGRRRRCCCSRPGWSRSRLGSEFLPELDEGDIVIFVEMPPSISLERGGQILHDVRQRLLAFPEVLETLSEQGRPGGRHRRRGRQHERDVRAPRAAGAVAARAGQGPPRRGDARVADRDPRRQLQLLAADQGQRRRGGQRRARQGRAEDLRHRSRRHADDARAVRRARSARCRASSTSGSIAMPACRSCRSCSTARRWRAPASASSAAQDVVETALGGDVATDVWENERPVPVRVIFPLAEREDEARIGNIPVPTASGGRVPLRELARIEKAIGRAAINREANSRVLALKFNVEGRDMGSVVNDAHGGGRRAR